MKINYYYYFGFSLFFLNVFIHFFSPFLKWCLACSSSAYSIVCVCVCESKRGEELVWSVLGEGEAMARLSIRTGKNGKEPSGPYKKRSFAETLREL